MSRKISGQCCCGAVAFTADADRDDAHACHCGQCRRWSGAYWTSVNVPYASLNFGKGEDKVGWFKSSGYARRGFCKDCGSALFWHADRHKDHAHRIANHNAMTLGVFAPLRCGQCFFRPRNNARAFSRSVSSSSTGAGGGSTGAASIAARKAVAKSRTLGYRLAGSRDSPRITTVSTPAEI